jgi:hypothetical protein
MMRCGCGLAEENGKIVSGEKRCQTLLISMTGYYINLIRHKYPVPTSILRIRRWKPRDISGTIISDSIDK